MVAALVESVPMVAGYADHITLLEFNLGGRRNVLGTIGGRLTS
jgi:hypothetical protein